MQVLLDTHALLWWLAGDPALSPAAHKVIANTRNNILVSAASACEIATKFRLGRIPTAMDLLSDFSGLLEQEGFQSLDIATVHAVRAGLLAGPHKDPFDRMLIAQAQHEGIPIVSNEAPFDAYGITRIW